LDYDSALLNITAATLATGLPAGWQISNFDNNATAGQVIVDLQGSTALSAGDRELIRLTASVPTTATFNAGEALEISGSGQTNTGTVVNFVDTSAVQKVAFPGNVNANGVFDLLDVAITYNAFRGRITGFDPYDLVDPILLANTNNNSVIDLLDVATLYNAFRQRPQSAIPLIPAGFTAPTSPGLDPTVQVASVTGNPGQTVQVALSITATEVGVNTLGSVDL
jgi:hypothetical protein